jgi:hypothetical protein
MKNFSKTIASISLSLLTVGAMAQTPSILRKPDSKPLKFVSPTLHLSKHKAISASANYAIIDYVDGDATISSNPDFTLWNTPEYMNRAYVLADTGISPLIGGAGSDADLITSETVVYDTIWDDISTSYITPTVTAAQPIMVDTVWAYMAYRNTSTTNDTLFVSLCAVNAAGFINKAVVYTTQTVVIPAGGGSIFPNNNLDSIQQIGVDFNHFQIPITARHHWNFAVNVTVGGSKEDTIGVWYYSQYSPCGAGGAVTSPYSAVGVYNGTTDTTCNSFITGLTWYNDVKNFGNGTQLTWPNTTSNFSGVPYSWAGHCMNTGGYYYYNQIYTTYSCVDTAYFPDQDLGIMAQIEYNTTPTGIANINNSGLSVGQNFPNPFNKETTINYSLTKASDVTFKVYDITGRVMATNNYGVVAPGQYTINLSANTFSPGIYFYTFNVGGNLVTKKMVITN